MSGLNRFTIEWECSKANQLLTLAMPPEASTALELDPQLLRRQVSELSQRCLRLEGGNLQLILTHVCPPSTAENSTVLL